MFFKKKKEKKPKKSFEERLEEWAKKHGLPKESVRHLAFLYSNANKGLLKILARADPEGRHDRVSKALGTKEMPEGYIYITHIKEAEYQKLGDERDPRAARFPILHGLLTLALIHHTGTSTDSIGDAVREALDNWVIQKLYYDELKKNPDSFIEELITQLEDRHLIIDKDTTRRNLQKALELAIKIVDKMPPDFRDPEKIHAVSRAISGAADDPLHILKQAGIDIEPELEEFREFLAEISGKKIETRKAVDEMNASGNIALEAQKLLGILNDLKFADYSERAVEKALKELDTQIEKLIEARNLELLGLYSTVALFLRNGRFEKAEEFLKKLSD